jgi:hypothetical protein
MRSSSDQERLKDILQMVDLGSSRYKFTEFYSEKLPVTWCEAGLRSKIDEMAQQRGVSAAAIVRVAVRFFLDVWQQWQEREGQGDE